MSKDKELLKSKGPHRGLPAVLGAHLRLGLAEALCTLLDDDVARLSVGHQRSHLVALLLHPRRAHLGLAAVSSMAREEEEEEGGTIIAALMARAWPGS